MSFMKQPTTTTGRILSTIEDRMGFTHAQLGERLGFRIFTNSSGEPTCPYVSALAYGKHRVPRGTARKLEILYKKATGESLRIPEKEIQPDELKLWWEENVGSTISHLKERLDALETDKRSLEAENERLKAIAAENAPDDILLRLEHLAGSMTA